MKNWSFVLVAAGKGSRMGGLPKQFRLLGGVPLWRWGVALAEELYAAGDLRECVLVMPHVEGTPHPSDVVGGALPIVQVEGGAERRDSVLAGIRAACGAWVMVHDGARPFCSPDLCRRVQTAAEQSEELCPSFLWRTR